MSVVGFVLNVTWKNMPFDHDSRLLIFFVISDRGGNIHEVLSAGPRRSSLVCTVPLIGDGTPAKIQYMVNFGHRSLFSFIHIGCNYISWFP